MDKDILNYQNYLQKKDHMTLEEMEKLHNNILKISDKTDLDFLEIWENLIQNSIKYTQIRADWNFYSKEKKLDADSNRTNIHNLVIDSFIILERYMSKENWNIEWTKLLFGENNAKDRVREDVSEHRKRIGDFANYLAFIYALHGR